MSDRNGYADGCTVVHRTRELPLIGRRDHLDLRSDNGKFAGLIFPAHTDDEALGICRELLVEDDTVYAS